MKSAYIIVVAVLIEVASVSFGQTFPVPDEVVSNALAGRAGTFVLIDCVSGKISDFNPTASAEKLPPCSTFKIWNTLIGLECGILLSPDAAFYTWDGQVRAIPDWNKNLTLKQAFQVSCVPAFQALARTIGPDRMQIWLKKIAYGDGDISAGIDTFWLPAKGRKTVLISPIDQARLMRRLALNDLPFSTNSMAILKEIMVVKKTSKGILYGKTGSRADDTGNYTMGWFVGYVESPTGKYAFACNIKGDNVMGKDARNIVEKILEIQGIL